MHSARIVHLTLLGLVAALIGCSSQRSLYVVRQAADRSYARGDFGAAFVDYKEYADRDPSNALVRWNLGRSLLKLGRADEAAENLHVAVDLDPFREEYRQTLAEALVRAGRADELYALLRPRARESGRWQDYLELGTFAQRLGDADEARQALLMAAKLDHGQHVEPQLALAEFYDSAGDREQAMERYRMVLYLDPDNAAADQALRQMGKIPGPSLALEPEEAGQPG